VLVNSLSVGDVIAGYRLDELLGRGGMGVVFLATHVALERHGAVKLIAPELAANEDFRQRFQRESKLAASIDHPHVIPIFDAGEEEGQLYVAMRYVKGTDLGAFLSRHGALAPPDAVKVIRQVADALDAAHERGLVHRDVKPANVLLESRGSGYHAYLTDFGLVKAVGAASGVLTRTGQWLGTPDYAAPEQILGAAVDARTDVYALGCMLYQTVAGKPPFERDNDVAKMFAHLSEPPPSLTAARPDLPAGLDAVVRTALAKEPAERHRSAGELASAAQRAVAGGAVEPVTPPPTVRAERVGEILAPEPTTSRRDASRSPSRRPAWLIPAAAGAVLAGVAALALLSGGGDGGGGGGGGGGEAGAGAGGTGRQAASVIPAGNLTSNASFEEDTSSWDVSESEIAREPASDAPDGANVVRVTLTGPPGDYSIDDDPDTVSSSRSGRIYTASAWVKATAATDDKQICISIRERPQEGGDTFEFSTAAVTASSSEYRELRVMHRASTTDSRIGVHVFRLGSDASEGEAFLVDAITLTEGGGDGGPAGAECD
jgi:hypothetical protein